jgi:tRNA G37 N-methylase Trm5
MEIQRFIPDKNSIGLYRSFIRGANGSTDTLLDSNSYLITVQKYEMDIEAYLKDVLNKLGISASVKTNRYSLLYEKEISNTQKRGGLNYNAFDLQQLARLVTIELLRTNVKKLRFYIIGDLILERDRSELGYSNSIIVKFRYTIHEKFEAQDL